MFVTDYGVVSRLPESASQGAKASLHGTEYTFYTGGVGWVADIKIPQFSGLEDAYDKPEIAEARILPKDFGEVDLFPRHNLVVGDSCFFKDCYWVVNASLHWEYVSRCLAEDVDPTENNGGTTDYYAIPEGANTCNDIIELKDMRFWRGEAFKALWALGERSERASDGSASEVRELNKVKYYVDRRLAQIVGRTK